MEHNEAVRKPVARAMLRPRPMGEIALIVEAHGVQAMPFKIAAQSEGLEPIWFRDAAAAIPHLSDPAPPRLLIVGLSTPDAEQLCVLRELRAHASIHHTPALVCSSLPTVRERAWAQRMELGISQLIARPASIEAVQQAIQEVLTTTGPLPLLVASKKLAQREPPPERLPPRHTLEEVARQVARAFSAAIAFVLIEGRLEDSVHVGVMGLSPAALSEWSLVRHVIDARSPLLAIDAGNALFEGDPIAERLRVRSFAAVPLMSSSGYAIGVLGILDPKSLAMTAADLDSLVAFGRRLTGELELLATIDDVTRTADRLASSLAQVQSILDHLDDGVLVLDPRRRILSANRAFARMFDAPASGWAAASFDDFVGAQAQRFSDVGPFEQAMRVRPEGVYAFSETVRIERPMRRVLRWSAKPIKLEGEPFQLHLVKDITVETDLLREKEQLAMTDALTGLGNRRASEEALLRELARSERDEHGLAMVLIDIDWFKRVNDRAGHAVGDRVLAAIGRAIGRTARRSDLAFRWGGEEFLVLLPKDDLAGARAFAERLRSDVEKIRVEGWDEAVTISSGASEVHAGRPQDAFFEADRRLYQAKREGRNRVR